MPNAKTEPDTDAVTLVLKNNNQNLILFQPVLFHKRHNSSLKLTPEEKVVGIMRSHVSGSKATTNDLIPLLADTERRDIGAQFVFVISHKEYELFIRTNKTPSINKEGIKCVRLKWNSKEQKIGLTNFIRGKKTTDQFVEEYKILKFSGMANNPILNKK